MCGSETLAIDVSSSSMKVASVTVNATAHGLTWLLLDEAGTARNSAVVVATVSLSLNEIEFRCILRPIGRKRMAAETTKSFRGEATRRRIVEQSAAVFNRHGYSGTSMSELMAATGLEKGGLYRHFASKQDLAAAAFDYAWETVSEPRWRGLEDCASAVEKLLLLVKNFVEQPPRTLPGGCPLLNTAVDSDDGNPLLRGKARAALDRWRAKIADIVQQGRQNGELRGGVDPAAVAAVVIASLEGAVMMSRLEKTREPLHTVGEHLAGYLQTLSTEGL
jgi:TetR/AcrR family transcriptional regulator, transcriptional repressor for nem operon